MAKTYAPSSEEELSSVVKSAAKSKTKLAIKGGGTRAIGNPVVAEETVVTTGINGISIYEPGALTIVAAAGTSLEKINAELNKESQHLPFEPADYSGLFGIKGQSTIGGVVAAAVSGPRRIQAGACRDSLIGIRFVDGEGNIVKNGGRVMKNVTGYDLVKLFAGSYGTLGILTEVAFKVLPKPEVTGVVRVQGLEDQAAIDLLAKALSSPFDVSGAAHVQSGEHGISETLVRVEGFEQSIKYRTEQLKQLFKPMIAGAGEISIDMDEGSTVSHWKDIRDVKPFHDSEKEIWRLSVKPSDGPKVVSELSSKFEVEALYDWGGGLVWLAISASSTDKAVMIRSIVNQFGGHATIIKAEKAQALSAEAFHPESARISQLSQGLRNQFDPYGIFNQGLMMQANDQLIGVN
ncbi:MAG: glycolate oxidase subunit GlcE [Salaquimonas sp.]